MKRSLLCFFLIVLFVIPVFYGCHQESDIADTKPYDSAYYDVSQFVVQYLEAMMHDPALAANLCYFQDEAEKKMYLQNLQSDPVASYEIIRFEKLSDDLWVIELHSFNRTYKGGIYYVNYVGITDGKMLVYGNKQKLPSILTEGLIIEEYKPNGPEVLD